MLPPTGPPVWEKVEPSPLNPPPSEAAPTEGNAGNEPEAMPASWKALRRAMQTLTALKSMHQGGNIPQHHPPSDNNYILRGRMSMPGAPVASRHSVNVSPQVMEQRTHSHTLEAGACTQSANLAPRSNLSGLRPPLGATTRMGRSIRSREETNELKDHGAGPKSHDEPSSCSLPEVLPPPSPLSTSILPPPFSPYAAVGQDKEMRDDRSFNSADAIQRGLVKVSSIASSAFSDKSQNLKNVNQSILSGSKAEASDPSISSFSTSSRSEGSRDLTRNFPSEGSRDFTRNFPSVKSKTGSQLFALYEEPLEEEGEHLHLYEELSSLREASIRKIEDWEVESPGVDVSLSRLDPSFVPPVVAFSFPTQPPTVQEEEGGSNIETEMEGYPSASNLSWSKVSVSSLTNDHRISEIDLSVGSIPIPPMPSNLEPMPSGRSKSPFMRMETQREMYKTIASFSSSENCSSSGAPSPPPPSFATTVPKSPLAFKSGGSPLLLRVGSKLEQGEWMSQGWTNNDIIAKLNPSMNQLFDRPTSFLSGPSSGYNSLQIIDPEDLNKVKELGRGATGRVWMAKWKGVEVALKEILDEGSNGLSPANKQQKPPDPFHEARILQSLSHPCFIHLYGVVQEEGSRAMIVELVRGGSLKSGLRRLAASLPPAGSTSASSDKKIRRVKASVAVQAARGMEYLHACNFVHFDLKSENLLCDLRDLERVVVKVSDLGLSAKKSLQYIEGNMRGTLPWMAPELFYQGDEEDLVTEKVDVWSFGVVLWEIWCLCQASSPYEGMSSDDLMAGLLTRSLRPTKSALPPGSPAMDVQWTQLLESCCHPDPRQRPSFTEIAERLEELEESWRKDEQPQDEIASEHDPSGPVLSIELEGSQSVGTAGSFNCKGESQDVEATLTL